MSLINPLFFQHNTRCGICYHCGSVEYREEEIPGTQYQITRNYSQLLIPQIIHMLPGDDSHSWDFYKLVGKGVEKGSEKGSDLFVDK